MNFPYNSTTTQIAVINNQDFIWLPASDKLLLSVNIQQSGVASETLVYCGSELFAKNYAKDLAQKQIYKECSQDIRVTKTGQDEAFITLVYHEGFLQNPQELISNENTGADFFVDKTLSYGDAVIIWFLTIFSVFMIFKVVYNFFWKK